MDKKEKYLEFVQKNPLVVNALKHAETEEERQKIKKLVEAYAEMVADAFVPVIDKIKNDPEYATKVRSELQRFANGQKKVVIDND